jgi:hypothetical protein
MQQLVADSAVTVYDITEVSVRQGVVHDRALGRVTSTFQVASGLAQLTATLAAGVLAEIIGLRATSWLAPIGGLLAAAVLWASPVRTLISLPEDSEGRLGRPATFGEAAAAAVLSERDQPVGG